MGIVIVMLVIIAGVGWIAWKRRRRQQAHAFCISSQGRPTESVAHNAFVHGNTCLMEGKFDEARAAFHQARDLEPTHVHIDARLLQLDLKRILGKSTFAQKSLGPIEGRINIAGTGQSFRELMATASGNTFVAMSGGEVSGLLVELAGHEASLRSIAVGSCSQSLRSGGVCVAFGASYRLLGLFGAILQMQCK